MEEFVRAAVAAGFHAYGISSHSPLPFYARCAMRAENVEEYLSCIDTLKREYAGQIELYAGMEIDYINEEYGPAIAYFRELPLDYRIGSIHYVTHPSSGRLMDMDGGEIGFRTALAEIFDGDLAGVVTAYYDASERMVARGGFDFVAHLDKVSVNAERIDPSITGTRWYHDRLISYLEAIAARGLMIEINTKAYPGLGVFFPHRRYMERIRELRIPVIVNSDAHYPWAINEGRAEAFEMLRAAGFRHTTCLKGGKWTEIPIGE
jgi:histidinol-phosphatase (PHP family)